MKLVLRLVLLFFSCNFTSIICNQLSFEQVKTIPPLTNRFFAFGLNVLRIQATIIDDDILYCAWKPLENCSLLQGVFYNKYFKCAIDDLSNCTSFFNCSYVERSKKIIIDFKFENLSNFVQIKINCPNEPLLWSSMAKNCSSTPPLLINSTSSVYNSSGNFYCDNGGTLVYSNGTKLLSPQTTCQASAEWFGQKDLECWKPPKNVQLFLKLPAVAEENVVFHCNSASASVFPPGYGFIVFIESIGNFSSQNQDHATVNVNKTFHNKKVYCQILSPYTQTINTSSGRSLEEKLNVWYLPIFSSAKCTWIVNVSGSCNVTVDSNPFPLFVSLRKNGSEIPIKMNSSADFYYKVVKLTDTLQVFTFSKKKVAKHDSGEYLITFSTIELERNSLTTFNISVSELQNISKPDILEIIFSAVGSAAFVFFLLILLICFKKRQGGRKSSLEDKHTYENTNKAENQFVADDVVYELPDRNIYSGTSDPGFKHTYIVLDNSGKPSELQVAEEVVYEIPDIEKKPDTAVNHTYINGSNSSFMTHAEVVKPFLASCRKIKKKSERIINFELSISTTTATTNT